MNSFSKVHRWATISELHKQKLIADTLWSYRDDTKNFADNWYSKGEFELPKYIDQPGTGASTAAQHLIRIQIYLISTAEQSILL